jgi:hypothetical protein
MILNFRESAARVERWQGREWTVVPMTMLVEGVHSGSDGPLLYRKQELSRNVRAWEMKPITVGHPVDAFGTPAWARDLSPTDRRQVGVVRNVVFSGKLRAEAWIDRERADAEDPRIGQAIDDGQMVEISTGLGVHQGAGQGSFQGQEYDAIATNHEPDHLAILLDNEGACSIRDGCGLLQLNQRRSKPMCTRPTMPVLHLPVFNSRDDDDPYDGASREPVPIGNANADQSLSPLMLLQDAIRAQYLPDADLIRTATDGGTQVALFYSGTDLYSLVFDRDVNGSFILQEPELLPHEAGSEVQDSGQSVSGDSDEPPGSDPLALPSYGQSAAGADIRRGGPRQQQLRPPSTKLTKTGWREEWRNDGASRRSSPVGSSLPTTMQNVPAVLDLPRMDFNEDGEY